MFYALAVVLCLAVFFIVLAGSSIVCAAGLWGIRRALPLFAPRRGANLLFIMRTLPFFLALQVTLGLALPAFLRFEPDSSGELIGLRLLGLGILGALIIGSIAVRCARVLRSTYLAQQRWRSHAEELRPQGVSVPVYCSEVGPLLAVTGIFRHKIFVTRSVTESLSSSELSAALAHEMAHVAAFDNLKQVLLKITRPPRGLGFVGYHDSEWLDASEIAADEGALAGGASPLDLSSALVKVGKMSHVLPPSDMVAASHLLPITGKSVLEMRIHRLQELLSGKSRPLSTGRANALRRYRAGFYALFLLFGYAVCLNAVLPQIHDLLEMLVR